MTLAVAIQADGGIVLASDSRATFGDPRGLTVVNDTVTKIFTPNPRIAIALSGVADTGNALMQSLKPSLAAQPMTDVGNSAAVLQQVGAQTFNQWFGPPQFMLTPAGVPVPVPRPEIVYLMVGYTGAGEPKIYMQASNPPFNFAPNQPTTGFSAIGVATLALYLLNRLYKPGMALSIAKDLAAYCILETASQDGKVGGPIYMAIVRHNRDNELLNSEQIKELDLRVERHRDALRNSFLTMDGAGPQDAAPQPAGPAPAQPA